MRKTYALLLFGISVVEFLPLFLAPQYPALKGDALGHLFKIHELMELGWKPWIEEWYAGFPFLRFYPPASYLLAAFFGKLFHSPIRGYAASLMLTSFIGALALHFYLRRLKKEPYVAPVLFLLFPWHLGVAYVEGNFPRANAINLSPLFPLAVLLLSEYRERYLLISALAVSLLVLTHHSIIIPLLILSIALHWENFGELRVLGNAARVGGVVVFLTAFWYVPFLHDMKFSNFEKISENPWLLEHYSLNPSLLLKPELLLPLIVVSLLWALAWKSGNGDLRKPALLALSIYLSLGAYSPTPWLYSLPVISLIPPYRWLDLTNLLVPLMAGDGLGGIGRRKKTLLGLATAVLLMLPFLGEVHPVKPVLPDTIALASYISNRPGDDWRFLVNDPGAVYSYIPALSGKDTLNGWYHEGNPADREMARLWYLLATNKNATFYLKAYCVKYLINAKQPGYKRVGKIGRYTVYETDVSFVQPVTALMVGTFYDLPLNYAYMKSLPANTSGIETIIYSGNPDKREEKELFEFVEKGGRLIWVPESSGNLFGVNTTVVAINSSELHSDVYNVSRFAPFRYGNFPWYGPVFRKITPLVTAGNWTLIGVKKIGNGTLYALGGNFLYHIIYTDSDYELGIIRGMVREKKVNVNGFARGEGWYSFNVTTDGKTLIRVSEAYFPYWRITVNGRKVQAMRDDRTGLTLIQIGGPSEVRATFKDPFERLRTYSGLAWAIVLLYTFLKFRPMMKLSGPEI